MTVSADLTRSTCLPRWQAARSITSFRALHLRGLVSASSSQQCKEASPSTSVEPAQRTSDESLPSAEYISSLRDSAELSRTGASLPSTTSINFGALPALLFRSAPKRKIYVDARRQSCRSQHQLAVRGAVCAGATRQQVLSLEVGCQNPLQARDQP